MSQPITRKTLARQCGGDMTAERLRKNERAWALHQCRTRTGNRSVLYDREKALRALRTRGLA